MTNLITDNFLIISIALLMFSWFFALIASVYNLRRDFVIYKTNDTLYQINPLNWSAPTWGERFQSHYRHYGPLLIVSRKIQQHNCTRGCCSWVEEPK